MALLEAALVAEPPLLARDGGFIAPGYDAELDETRRLRDEGRGVIAGMQAEYVQADRDRSLKIKHNNVLGYFIETTDDPCGADAVAAAVGDVHPPADHRRTQVRFTTVPLSEIETRILNAGNHALEIEKRLYRWPEGGGAGAGGADRRGGAGAGGDRPGGGAWPSWRRRRTGCEPVVDDSRAFGVDGRAAPGGGAGAAAAGRAPSSPTTAR